MRGFKGSGSAIQWSLSGNIRTWGGLQCHMRGYIWLYGSLWSLNGTIRVMGWFQCHMRGYKVFRLSASWGAIQWSLSGTRRICGGLQCQKTLGMLFNGL